MSAPVSGPLLRLQAAPSLLSGSAWGVTKPVLLCSFTLRGPPEPGIEALQAVLDTLVDNPYPPDNPQASAEGDADQTLLCWLHRCCAAIQREQNVPAFGPCKVLPGEGDGDARALVLAMPCPAAGRAACHPAVGHGCRERRDPWRAAGPGRSSRQSSGLAPAGAPRSARAAPTPFTSWRPHAPWPSRSPRSHPRTLPLGFGERSRWISSSVTDRTPQIGVQIARRKDQTSALLRQCGLPVPQQRLVRSEAAAAKAALGLGFPVVVKPADQEQGRGVFTRLRDEAQVRHSWRGRMEHSRSILVECRACGRQLPHSGGARPHREDHAPPPGRRGRRRAAQRARPGAAGAAGPGAAARLPAQRCLPPGARWRGRGAAGRTRAAGRWRARGRAGGGAAPQGQHLRRRHAPPGQPGTGAPRQPGAGATGGRAAAPGPGRHRPDQHRHRASLAPQRRRHLRSQCPAATGLSRPAPAVPGTAARDARVRSGRGLSRVAGRPRRPGRGAWVAVLAEQQGCDRLVRCAGAWLDGRQLGWARRTAWRRRGRC